MRHWLQSYILASRFPQIPQPGLTDPQMIEALLVIAEAYDAVEPEARP